MARLDRLAPAKAVAQFGAAIGREFEHGLLSAVAHVRPEVLSEGLSQLLAAGLIFERGVTPEVTYTFKHALVQDAAYASRRCVCSLEWARAIDRQACALDACLRNY